MQALRVEPAFAGDDEVRGGDARFHSDLGSHHVEAAHQTSAEEGHQTEAEAARGAGAGDVARVDAEVATREVGQVCEPLFEPSEVTDAFLGTIDPGGSAGAAEGVIDVAGHDQLEGGEGGRPDDLVRFEEGLEGGGEVLPPALELVSQGEGDPEAPVVGGAPADADQQPSGAFPEGGLDKDSCT